MGKHAGDRGRARGLRVTEDVWPIFLGHLATMSAIEVSKLSGMPSAVAFGKKRKRDAEFRSQADTIIATRKLINGGRPRITAAKWTAFLEALPHQSINALCARDDMPSMAAVYKRRRTDEGFRASLDAVLHDVRRERDRRIASALRLSELQKAPAFRERMLAALATWRAAQPKKPKPPTRKWRTPQIALVEAPKPAPGTIFAADLLRNELYSAAAAAVPRYLDQARRDDVIADLVLAVLEGEIEIAALPSVAKSFVARHDKLFGTFTTVSLDAPLRPGSNLTIGGTLTGAMSDRWEAA